MIDIKEEIKEIMRQNAKILDMNALLLDIILKPAFVVSPELKPEDFESVWQEFRQDNLE